MLGDLIFYQPHLFNKIIFYFKGLSTPSAIAMNQAFHNKELVRQFNDIDPWIGDFYEEYCAKEYLVLENNITTMYIPHTTRPDIENPYEIPPLEYGSFFRKNLLSYREREWEVEDYNMLFEFIEIIPQLNDY